MQIVDRGTGIPLVLVPGLQGRWEYFRPAVDALTDHFRVITFPLSDERVWRRSGTSPPGLDAYADQVRIVLDQLGVQRAAIVGISFGGVIALRFAAQHPARTAALVLASTPGPRWQLRRRHALYARLPWLFGPVFLAETPWRVRREIVQAISGRRARLRFQWQQVRTLVSAPLSLSRMAARARLMNAADRVTDCGRIAVPTFVITGERPLDYVVSVDGTSDYGRLISGACTAVLRGTGHLGSITRPREFAALVREFLDSAEAEGTNDAA